MPDFNEIKKYVEEVFREGDEMVANFEWFYKYHISIVYKIAIKLAKKYKANETVVGLAAILHDIGITVDPKQHDIAGAKEAERILKKYGYAPEIIKQVSNCIESHMCEAKKPNTLEAKIVATADAVSKFKSPFFFIKACAGKQTPEEYFEWFHNKIKKEYEKIFFDDEKRLVKKEYEVLSEMCKFRG